MRIIGTNKNGDEIAEVSVTELDTMFREIRAKAIDEFVEKIKEKEEELYEADGGGIYNDSRERAYNNGIMAMDDVIDKIAEDLKAGGEDG